MKRSFNSNWEWLGFLINTREMTFTVPSEKVARLRTKLKSALKNLRITARNLTSIAGELSSMQLAVGPITRLQTRALYATIAYCNSWYSR